MPGAPLANVQLGRVAWSRQRMPAFRPFADAYGARCDGPLLAESVSTGPRQEADSPRGSTLLQRNFAISGSRCAFMSGRATGTSMLLRR